MKVWITEAIVAFVFFAAMFAHLTLGCAAWPQAC